ncbi:MAG: ABC transporter ATP-binding protein [Anderseniella sp.]|jgi:spermidine/putrescine ABC transporter ATP-binding subunit|nr:ABC transporter ATP-binding protein [Anderseniella sp.]
MQPIVSIQNVTKRYPGVIAVDNVSFDIMPNEFFALLGPSGCGKTTLLRMIAGLETGGEGGILIDGQNMAGVPANRRPVNMVFQSYAVFPHMTVRDNVAYGLKVTGTPSAEVGPRVEEALEMVQMGAMADRKPDQLSGGQRQRVALARALVKRPKVLLLDEPLSALDAKLREHMQLELARLQQAIGITFIIVTHDQDEALSMADRIAVMEKGQVRQIAGPEELYEKPKSRFVADFIGKINLIDAEVSGASKAGLACAAKGLGKVTVPFDGKASGKVSLAVRPEKLDLLARAPASKTNISLKGEIRDVAYYGDVSNVFVTCADGLELQVNVQNDRAVDGLLEKGRAVWLSWHPEDTLVLTQ